MRIFIINRTRHILCFGLATVLAFHAKSQVNETESHHIVLAGTGVMILTEGFMPVVSQDINVMSLTYSFATINARRKKSIMAGFERGAANADKNSVRSNEFILQYATAFSLLKDNGGKWNNYTGYSITVNPQYSRTGEQYSWATVNSMSLYNSLTWSSKKNILSFDLVVPLVGFSSRPRENTIYKGSANAMLYNSFSRLSFTSLHNLKALDISFKYQRAVTGSLRIISGGSYSYKELSVANSFLRRGFGLHAGLSYGL